MRWRKAAMVRVEPYCVDGDLFHKEVPFEFIDRVFAVMALCPQHTFQILTKRPERMAEYLNCQRTLKSGMGSDQTQSFVGANKWVSLRMNAHHGRAVKNTYPLSIPVEFGEHWPLKNVWLGTSCENQEAADRRIGELVKCPAAKRFLSLEPLLGPIDLNIDGDCSDWACRQCGSRNVDTEVSVGPGDIGTYRCLDCNYFGNGEDAAWRSLIDWVIVGGESGSGARPCNIEWIRSIVAQCKAAGVPVFVKQLGAIPTASYYDRDLRQWYDGEGWEWPDPIGWHERDGQPTLDSRIPVEMKDPKGGTMEEWPEDLRVREMPGVQG
jgi:protein gp37